MIRMYIITGCILSLILMIHICWKFVFPTFRQWIVDLSSKLQDKMQNRILKLKKDEDKWKQNIKAEFEEDVAMELEKPMTEDEIDDLTCNGSDPKGCLITESKKPKSMYEKRWVQEEQQEPGVEEYFETENQIAKVLSNRKDKDEKE